MSEPTVWMPAFATATSMPPKRSTVPGDGALERLRVGHVGLEPGGAVAELRGALLEQVGLEPDERDVRALRVHPLGDAARRCRAPRR